MFEETISLAGIWQFRRDDAKIGAGGGWSGSEWPSEGGETGDIFLPGTTDEAEAGVPNPEPPGIGMLYRPNVYEGAVWYRRDFEVPDWWKAGNPRNITLFLERVHWETQVWIDDDEIGVRDSLVSPHSYELGTGLAAGTHQLTIRVDNTRKFNLGKMVHSHFEGTQTNWNGIIGAIELRASCIMSLGHVNVFPDVDRNSIRVEAAIRNLTGEPQEGEIQFYIADDSRRPAAPPLSVAFSVAGTDARVETDVFLGENPKLWDEFSPHLYSRTASMTAAETRFFSERHVSFGLRKFEAQGTQFALNGRPLLLRGTLDNAIFPLTGYPPCDVEAWRRFWRTAKSYGLNHIRFHSWCPPEAAFTAGDLEGMILNVEPPMTSLPLGENPDRDRFIENESLRILDSYGNHPSFCLFSIGNEFNGPVDVMTRWVGMLIAKDPRHLYTSAACSRVRAPNREWTISAGGRGIRSSGTLSDASLSVLGQRVPSVGHEIGQWAVYPNFREISKYTGVLRAGNFELIRDDLQDNGMLDQAEAFFEATGKQAALLYKEDIENQIRTRNSGGFALLDLRDYPGQGSALVGMLDAFWDSKGIVTPEEHRRYCGPSVPLLRFPKRCYSVDDDFVAQAQIAHFLPTEVDDVVPQWTIEDETGRMVASGELPPCTIPTGALTDLGVIRASFAKSAAPACLTVTLRLEGIDVSNSWRLWLYPKPVAAQPPAELVVSDTWDEPTREALRLGKKVLLLPTLAVSGSIAGSFKPVYWSPVWFAKDPTVPNTMGILCDPGHPLFASFPTDFHSDWQWWNLIEGSQTMILSSTAKDFRPIVQVIDNFSRNEKLASVFEAKVGDGSLLVCTLSLKNDGLPEVAQFLKSLYAYMASESFAPSGELTFATLDIILPPSGANDRQERTDLSQTADALLNT